MNKNYLIVAALIIIILGGLLFYFGRDKATVDAPTNQNNTSSTNENTQTTSSTESNSDVLMHATVIYTDGGYSPSTVTIKKGGEVTFVNSSSRGMWTASAVHPTHAEYPTTGGCLGSTFDACQNTPGGETWSFQFDYVGTWSYHNHSFPSHSGKVVVEE